MSPLSLCLSLVSLLFPLFTLILIFISVFSTDIVPLLLSCSHYFHSTACTYKPLLSLYYSRSPAAFFLFFPGFVVSINIFLWLELPSLSFTLFPSHHLFALVIFPFCSIFVLHYFVRFVITCTTFLPFPCFNFIMPLSNATSLMTTLQCLYHFHLSSTLYLLVPFFFCLITNILPQVMPPPPSPPLSFIWWFFWAQNLPSGNENWEDFKVSSEVPPSPLLPIL